MQSYTMTRYTLVAPRTTNDGAESGYPEAVRAALLAAGIDGWTEHATRGYWRGRAEWGVTFEFYRADTRNGRPWPEYFARQLGQIGRRCMPDQEAVQVTMDNATTTLWEA